jgi:glycosyltransferase involved in cell wall biosynthesis
MLNVTHFQRLPAPGQVSIERVFAQVRGALPNHIRSSVHLSPRLSRGILPRLANLVDAAHCRGELNHIVGDVHYLALAVPACRTMLTIHDCVSLERLRGLKRSLFRWIWYVLPLRQAALVSVVSESTKRELLDQVPCDPSKIRVIHNCVGNEFLPFCRPFNKTNPVILQVGTSIHKNLDRIGTALSGIRCTLKIIGPLSCQQRRMLQDRRISFVNRAQVCNSELVQAYRDSDLVIFASTYEGFGLPILEANATGRPVITSQIFSMPEVAGAAACFVDPYDVRSIRAGVLRLLTDDRYRRHLVAAGFENVKRFTPANIASQYADAYEEILRRPGPASPPIEIFRASARNWSARRSTFLRSAIFSSSSRFSSFA